MIIAGAVGGRPPAYLQSLTDKLLDEQRIYGGHTKAIVSATGSALGAGHMPGAEPNLATIGDWVLLADARLDNRDELEERVGGPAGRTDADLLLALWLREGEDSLAWIAGDFALAIFDPRSRSLSLARDVAGQRPLFYTQTDFGLAFASMPAGLRPALPDFKVNPRSLALVAMDSPIDDGETFFDPVRSVRQAEVVRFSSNGCVARNIYWTAPPEPPDHGDRRALIEEYRHVLEQAVRPRLGPAPAVIATHLSGGFDSSSVAATAVRLLGNPNAVIGFTSAPALAIPREREFSFFGEESELAADVAASYGFRHVVVRTTTPIPDIFRSQTTLLQQPVREPFNGAWWVEIEARAAAMGAGRLLTGELGNLTINAGNLAHLSEWPRRRRWVTWFNQARAASRRPDVKWRGALYHSFRPWMPLSVSSTLERIFLHQRPHDKLSFVRPEWRHVAKHQRLANIYAERLAIIRGADSASVRKAALAQHGIEESDPFSDRRLIEFAFRIPPDQLYWNGVQRPLMRDALADRLPASLFAKIGRGLQSADWAIRLKQAEAFALLEEISSSRAALDILDLDRMRKVIERWPTRNWNEPSIAQEFRLALLDAIGVGMFAAAYD
jgi:asparagine synthase (glutamine-hydrolysing)